MADKTATGNEVFMAYHIEAMGDKLSNYAQLIFTVAEAFEAHEETVRNGWTLRPIAEGIQDIADDCAKTLSIFKTNDGEAVE